MFAADTRRIVLAAVIAAAALGGCGRREDASGDVERMLRAGFTTSEPAVLCERTLSAGLAARVYGSRARCVAAERVAAPSRVPASLAEISRISVEGDRGSAFVALRGGDQDGTRGSVTVVREDGGWRLDDLSTAFLRSQLRSGAENAQLGDDLSACLGASLDELGDAALRRLALGAMGGRPQALTQVQAIVARCVRQLTAPPAGDVA